MQDVSLVTDPAVGSDPSLPQPVAPWWHTIAVLALIATWAGISGTRTHSYAGTPHPILYISQIMMSWMLFGTVTAGVIHRRAFFFSTLRNRARSFMADAAGGLAIYLGIYFSVVTIVFVMVFATTMYQTLHSAARPSVVSQTQSPPKTQSSGDTVVPPPAPAVPAIPKWLDESRLHFDTKTVFALAPRKPLDLLLWIAVSCTAGFCEEHIFRGYLLKQALAFTGSIGTPRLLATIVSIVATSLIFGSLHLYEGVGGALVITALGAIYSIVAIKLGNLRAVIAAHFLQDFCAGLFLFLSHGHVAR